MATNFSIGDDVIPNEAYLDRTLSKNANTPLLRQTVQILGNLRGVASEILAIGVTTTYPTTSYVRLLPSDTSHPYYKLGTGVSVYFPSDEICDNSLEKSTAYLRDKCYSKVLNSTGSTITRLQLVRQVGFDATMQLPTVDLADATTVTNAVVFGVAMEDIADGEMGTVLTDGAYQVDTTGFTLGAQVFVSDTPGDISITAGTEDVVCGRVLEVAADGTISFFSTLTGGGSGAAAGGGFFTDGTGTDAGIGKGATAPTASGANALAHGDSCAANGDHSFAQGSNNSAAGYGFAQGSYNTVTANYSFAQGYGNSVSQEYGFAQGYTNTVSGEWGSFAQGFGNTVYADYGFAQGYGNSANGVICTSQGYNNDIQTPFARRVFVHGVSNTVGNSTVQQNDALIQGSSNSLYSTGGYGRRVFIQGASNTLTVGGYTQGVMIQGAFNNVQFARESFVQGQSITSTTTAGMYETSIQGANNTIGHSGYMYRSSLQGGGHSTSGTGLAQEIFAQGRAVTISTGASEVSRVLAQGATLTVTESNDVLAQGNNHSISGTRTFAQGQYCDVPRDDQKTWGSSRAVVGGAQSSKIVKHRNTSDAVQTTFITLDLEEDKTYGLRGLVVARNTTTNAESASFVLTNAIAYRDTAGAAVLVGSPVSFTRADSGGGAASWLVDIAASGNNILLRITGDATDTVEWCADLEFVEVAG